MGLPDRTDAEIPSNPQTLPAEKQADVLPGSPVRRLKHDWNLSMCWTSRRLRSAIPGLSTLPLRELL
jgi:hypothetical protein